MEHCSHVLELLQLMQFRMHEAHVLSLDPSTAATKYPALHPVHLPRLVHVRQFAIHNLHVMSFVPG